jgi:urease accessory protein
MPVEPSPADSLPLLRLLHLFDSQLPVGAFAHSGGLETYGQAGAGLPALRRLVANQVALGWGRGELAAACLAWSAADESDASDRLARLGQMASARKVVPAIRESSLRLGRRTLGVLGRLYPQVFAGLEIAEPHHALVIGSAGRRLELPRERVLLGLGHSLLAGSLAAATRCMPLSPMQAQEIIVALQPALVRAVERVESDPEAAFFTCTPALDVRAHQQGSLTTRLFQS